MAETKLSTAQLGGNEKVWNESNLVSGKNVKIEKHINPNVITDDTYALFHLDESLSNEISGSSAALSPRNGNTTNWEYTDSATGFGKGVWATSDAQGFDFLLTAPESVYKNAWTLDFRIYNKYASFDSTVEYIGRLFSAVPSFVLRGTIDYGTTTYGLQFLNTFYVPIYNYNTNQYVYKTGANKLEGHVAFTYDPETYHVTAFFNGVKVGTVTGNAPASLSDTTFFYTRNYYATSMMFDEIRLSKGIIYTGDTYEVPTEPYAEETGDGYWELNTDGLAKTADLDSYATTSSVTTGLAAKQDTLVAGTNISIAADGKTISATDTTYSAFTGTDGSAAGTAGLVPAPATTDDGKYLKADGTWATVSTGDSLPDQTGQSGKFLTTDGTDASWAEIPAGGVAPTTKSFTGQTGATLATGLTLADYDTIMVFLNGSLQAENTTEPAVTNDYSISDNNIVFTNALIASDTVTLVCLGDVASAPIAGADTSLSNLTDAGKIKAAHLAMPSDVYDELTIPTDGTELTAPADGYFAIAGKANGSSPILSLLNKTTNVGNTACSNFTDYLFYWTSICCSKGDVVRIGHYLIKFDDTEEPGYLRFVYANGSESEYTPS